MAHLESSADIVFIYKQWDQQLFCYSGQNGDISLMQKPPGGEQLPTFITYLKQKKIDILVSLLQFDEINQHGLVNANFYCQESNIEFINFQINDHSVPQFFLPFNQLIKKLADELKAGKNIVIHCYAGIGRTGITAAAILIKLGMHVDEALIQLSQVRGLRVPETLEQISWLHHHAQQLSNEVKII